MKQLPKKTDPEEEKYPLPKAIELSLSNSSPDNIGALHISVEGNSEVKLHFDVRDRSIIQEETTPPAEVKAPKQRRISPHHQNGSFGVFGKTPGWR